MRFLISLLLFNACCFLFAFDGISIRNYTDRDGLTQNTVRSMLQDKDGFMWMGTINGLNRFNGKEFELIQPSLNADFIHLVDNKISSVIEDRNGHIWTQTFSNAVYCYDIHKESYVDYDVSKNHYSYRNIKTMSNGDVWLSGSTGCCRVRFADGTISSWHPLGDNYIVSFIFEDSLGQIWIGTQDELFKLSGDDVISVSKGTRFFTAQEYEGKVYMIAENKISSYHLLKKLYSTELNITQKDEVILQGRSYLLPNGLLLLAGRDDIRMIDLKKPSLLSYPFLPGNTKIPNARFHTDNHGSLWISNMSGVLWRHTGERSFTPFELIHPEILSLINSERYSIYHDSRDIIWITTFGNGLFALHDKTGQMHHYTTLNELPTNYLFTVMEDSSGEVWVGTELAGAVKISLKNYPYEVFYPEAENDGSRKNAVRLIYEDSENNYWFGTREGNLYVCDSLLKIIYKYTNIDGLPFSIDVDTLGNKWLGTKGGGITILSPDGNKLLANYRLSTDPSQMSSSDNIYTVLRDNRGRMWAASFGGGVHLATKQKNKISFKRFTFLNSSQNLTRSMIQDKQGYMWTGTNDGVIIFHPDSLIQDERAYVALQLNARGQQSIGSNEVRVIFEDSQGRIWLGTAGGGVNLLMRENPIENSWFEHYDSKNGLSNAMIQSIQEDVEGNLWVSTESGISKFDPNSERFENFFFSNNRYAPIFNELSSWKKKNGALMFGSYNGVYVFNPVDIIYDTYAPNILITGLKINGNKMNPGEEGSPLKESITTARKLILKHNQNSFNIECTMLNFYAPEFNQYTYYLEGFEKDWNAISRENVATYRNVPPGTYTFKVKGSNSFGVWNDQETNLIILISPPWWKSGWAIAIYCIVILIVGYFIIQLVIKMQRLNMAVAVEKRLTDLKLQFFTNISHEFRTPLTLIRGAIENMLEIRNLPTDANKQIKTLSKSSSRLLRLIDQLLEFRRLQNDQMELNLVSTEANAFFHNIYLAFKSVAKRKNINYLFESNQDEMSLLLDQSKMDKVVYNLLSNAFKFTPLDGVVHLKINFSTEQDVLTVSVSDSGPGIPEDKRDKLFQRFYQTNYVSGGTGIGLHLTAELVQVHKGSIRYKDSEYGGACFSFTIPLSDKHYDKINIVNESSVSQNDTVVDIEKEELADEVVERFYDDYLVMIIEDDDDVRDFIESQLTKYFKVSTATNGVEGIAKIAEEQPNIVVCDVMMPEMDGYEFTANLKNNFDTSHIPVILLTAYTSEEHKLQGIESGADAYITKPFSAKYLITRVIKLIEQREKLLQKYATEPGLVRSSISSTNRDKVFLDELHQAIETNMDNAEFKIELFAQSLTMSRTTFFRKVKGITGYAPNEYLRIVRMKKAAELLMDTDLNVSEIAYQIGINDPFYFSKCFKKQFGKSPSKYRTQH